MKTTITRAALALAIALALGACGGEDPPLVASSTQQQSAPQPRSAQTPAPAEQSSPQATRQENGVRHLLPVAAGDTAPAEGRGLQTKGA